MENTVFFTTRLHVWGGKREYIRTFSPGIETEVSLSSFVTMESLLSSGGSLYVVDRFQLDSIYLGMYPEGREIERMSCNILSRIK